MSHEQRFQLLAKVVEIANTSVAVAERLDSILGVLTHGLKARQALLFLEAPGEGHVNLSNAWPHLPPGRPMPRASLAEGVLGRTTGSRASQQMTLAGEPAEPGLAGLYQPGDTAAFFPVLDDGRHYGVLVLICCAEGALTAPQMQLLEMAAREMAGVIRNNQLYTEAKKRIAELNVISELGHAAISTIEVDQLMDTIASICAKLLGVRGGMVRVSSTQDSSQTFQSQHGHIPDTCLSTGTCYNLCRLSLSTDQESLSKDCEAQDVEHAGHRGICVPLTFKGAYRGNLCVFDKYGPPGDPPAFGAEDKAMLNTMASMVSAALENALTFQRVEELAQHNEEMVGALGTLYEISTVLMTTLEYSQVVQMILHAVTHPAGLDHDRALLFVVDQDESVLRLEGVLEKPATGRQKELVHQLLSLQSSKTAWLPKVPEELRGFAVPMHPSGGLLAVSILEQRSVRVADPGQHPGLSPDVRAVVGNAPLAAVPLFAKNRSLGLLVVNNQRSGRPINDREMKLLAMLANLGAQSLEAARLYRELDERGRELAYMRNRLLEADKLAALGEVAAGVAHEIRNPLVSIGGFTRRIRKKVGDDSPITSYLDVIIEEVTRLERTLSDMLDFSTDDRHNFEEHDLNTVVEQSLDLMKREIEERGVEVERHLAPELPVVCCDDRQLKHVFMNLILNALQAMEEHGAGGKLTVRTLLTRREGKALVAAEVTDTGGGVPMEALHNVFNPFFTTKDKGSGLGLSIVHKIVTRHLGHVEVHNNEGVGATFVVALPAAEEGRDSYLK